MTFEEIFNNERFDLPIRKYDKDYYIYLEKLFEDYIKAIEAIEGVPIHKSKYKEIEIVCRKIIRAVKNVYEGRQDLAFKNLENGLDAIKDKLIIRNISSDFPFEGHLYKIRLGKNQEYSIGDIFHIPFQLRHIVQSFRYSIPGHPSLYLGSTAYVCWNETRRPNFDEVHITSYKLRNEKALKVLDFGYRPCDILYYYKRYVQDQNLTDQDSDFIRSYSKRPIFDDYIYLWPLIASCSFRVKNDGATFKPEYIIPQLLLQWLRKNKHIDAIRYFSVSTDYSFHSNGDNPIEFLHNYVFPTTTMATNGYCPNLSQCFEVTKPVVWGLCDVFEVPKPSLRFSHMSKIEIMNEVFVAYHKTKFYEIENLLSTKRFYPLSTSGIL